MVREQDESLEWIAVLLQVFVLISVIVSYLTLGAGFQHMSKYYPCVSLSNDISFVKFVSFNF